MLIDKISWLGHSSIRISAEKVVYFDPWKLKGKPEKADLVLVSHSHYDHFSPDDISALQKKETVVVCTPDCKGISGQVRTVEPGDSLDAAGIHVDAVHSYNPKKAFHPKESAWVGYVITLEGKRIYYCGDTDLIPEMKDIKADIMIVPVGGTYTMTAEEAARAVDLVKPEAAIPIHYGDIVGSEKDAKRFASMAGVPVRIIKPQ